MQAKAKPSSKPFSSTPLLDVLRELSKKLDVLYVNKNATSFKDLPEKVAYYQKAIDKANAEIQQLMTQITESEEVIKSNANTIAAQKKRINEIENEINLREPQINELNRDLAEAKTNKIEIATKLKDLIYLLH